MDQLRRLHPDVVSILDEQRAIYSRISQKREGAPFHPNVPTEDEDEDEDEDDDDDDVEEEEDEDEATESDRELTSAAKKRRKRRRLDSDGASDDIDDDEGGSTGPIRAEVYTLNDEDAEFVAADDEVEFPSSPVLEAEVDAHNILPSGSRRTRGPREFLMLVPTPDDDALLVDDGETSSDEDDDCEGDDGKEEGVDTESRRVWPSSSTTLPATDEEYLDELDGEWVPYAHEEEDEGETYDDDPTEDTTDDDRNEVPEWDDDI
jgi:hypothetical protein